MTTSSLIWRHPDWPDFQVSKVALSSALAAAHRSHGATLALAESMGLANELHFEEEVLIAEVLASSAIEGIVLNTDAVRSSVMRKLGSDPHAPIQIHVDGLVEMMTDATLAFDAPLDEARLCGWQFVLFPLGRSGMHVIETGRYRTSTAEMKIVSGSGRRQKIHYVAPPADVLDAEMKRFLNWFNEHSKTEHDGIVRAALAHLWFETLHPFEDGNGRIGRALCDMALAQSIGSATRLQSLSAAFLRNKAQYYEQLSDAQHGAMDVTVWVAWFIGQFEQACVHAVATMQSTLEKHRMLSRSDLNERQRKVLAKLYDVGPTGFQGGLSAANYVAITQTSSATASRDLSDLIDKGVMVATGKLKGTRYALARKDRPARS